MSATLTSDPPAAPREESLPAAAGARALDAEGRRLGFRLTLPTQLLILFIAVFPLLMQLYIAMTDWSPLDGTPWWRAYAAWNRFANFTDLAGDMRFWRALGRTFLVMAICVPAELGRRASAASVWAVRSLASTPSFCSRA